MSSKKYNAEDHFCCSVVDLHGALVKYGNKGH